MLCVSRDEMMSQQRQGSKSTVKLVFTSAAEKATFLDTNSVTAATVQGGKKKSKRPIVGSASSASTDKAKPFKNWKQGVF